MANIRNPKIAVQENLPGGKVKVDVTCKVNFTAFELFMMQNGVRFRLDCTLRGDDPINDNDLFSFPRKTFPSTHPGDVTFTATISSGLLNEDDTFPDYTDEVYAALTLKNLETGVTTSARTQNLSHHF